MTGLSNEQKAIIDAPLVPLSVIACAGSGKTWTAVHRLAELRKRLGNHRGRVALLSFSNTAVETFRDSYLALAPNLPDGPGRTRVDIDTIDGFITTNVLHPHAYRTMGAAVAAYLVTGGEPFLHGFKFNAGSFPQAITQLQVGFREGEPYFYCSFHDQVTALDRAVTEAVVSRLGRTGAYTHNLGRYWCYRTLQGQAGILRALARRYPYILVDEAQDIGTPHQTILELLADAGVQISLIGDPNQGIYEFAGADGSYLKKYATRPGVSTYALTRNYRSVPPIVSMANALAARTDTADRPSPATQHGAFFVAYRKGQREHLIEAFQLAVKGAGLRASNSVIVCRGRSMADELAGVGAAVGQGTLKVLAQAAVIRDREGDYLAAFKATAAAVVALLATPPRDLLAQITQSTRFPEMWEVRREVWDFTRTSTAGLPSSILLADTEWHPLLLTRIRDLLIRLETKFGLVPADNLGQRLSKKGLPSAPLMTVPDLAAERSERLRVDTVHQVKGESLDAVLYIATKEHVQALLAGVGSEVGRIGYVAVTRAKDLFWLGVPANCIDDLRADLLARGFQEAGVDADASGQELRTA